jgi:hypothetical protein
MVKVIIYVKSIVINFFSNLSSTFSSYKKRFDIWLAVKNKKRIEKRFKRLIRKVDRINEKKKKEALLQAEKERIELAKARREEMLEKIREEREKNPRHWEIPTEKSLTKEKDKDLF